MPSILIDTNLLIYLYDPNQPERQKHSERVLEQLELNRSGRLSVQALAEFFSVATRKLSEPHFGKGFGTGDSFHPSLACL
jgi:predicted nucleic acid-binding protein